MGQIADLINSFDPATREQNDISAQLDLLADLAKTKANLARETIEHELLTAGTEFSKSVPISSVRDRTIETHAYASSNANAIVDTVQKSVDGFIKGGSENILSGVCNLLSAGLTAFLGGGEGADDTFERMFIVDEGLSLLRFDVWGWRKTSIGKGIKTKVQCVSAFVGFKSVINFQRLDFPTFLSLYQVQLLNGGMPKDNMLAALTEARKIYQIMNGNDAVVNEVAPTRNVLAFNNGFLPRALA